MHFGTILASRPIFTVIQA